MIWEILFGTHKIEDDKSGIFYWELRWKLSFHLSVSRLSSYFLLQHEGSISRMDNIPMILSILLSPTLVFCLMVIHDKNPVYSILFPIPLFHDTSCLHLFIYLFFCLGLGFFAKIFPVVHIGAIVSFIPIRCYDVPY